MLSRPEGDLATGHRETLKEPCWWGTSHTTHIRAKPFKILKHMSSRLGSTQYFGNSRRLFLEVCSLAPISPARWRTSGDSLRSSWQILMIMMGMNWAHIASRSQTSSLGMALL